MTDPQDKQAIGLDEGELEGVVGGSPIGKILTAAQQQAQKNKSDAAQTLSNIQKGQADVVGGVVKGIK